MGTKVQGIRGKGGRYERHRMRGARYEGMRYKGCKVSVVRGARYKI